MRSITLIAAALAVVLPASAAPLTFEVTFLTVGEQSCAFSVCTDRPGGTIESAMFALDHTQLDAGGVIPIAGIASFPNIVPIPSTENGTEFLFAIAANGTVDDILISVEWVQYILDFGTNYSFIASTGQWLQVSNTTGGPLDIRVTRFGTYTIDPAASPVPEPGSALILGGLALCLAANRRRAQVA